MILAAGLTPAWQQIVLLDRLRVGEVNRARQAVACASGKVLNVAIALKHLGAEHRVLAPLGGTWREAIQQDIAALGVQSAWLLSRTPTRVCTTILDEAGNAATELVENARGLSSVELDVFARVFRVHAARAKIVVLRGSLTAGAPAAFYRDLLEGFGGQAILDARSEELLLALPRRPWLVKPNRDELAACLGRAMATDDEVWRGIDQLSDRGARNVLITEGAQPAFLWLEGSRYRITPPKIDVVNPIGCGDCLAAGVAAALAAGRQPLDCLRQGFACAADNAGQLLPARLDRARVEELARQVGVLSI